MGKTLYLECTSGISGDMAVAALLDAGASEEVLRRVLASLPVQGFEVQVSRVNKSGLDVCDFDVVLDAAHENHDHDMAYLYGTTSYRTECDEQREGELRRHTHSHDHEHLHAHKHPHDHGHPHAHEHPHDQEHPHDHEHSHEHRGLAEVLSIVDGADMTARAKNIAHRIFEVLADAEAKAHGVAPDEVHFHEVGAVDSIVDIIAAAVCLDNLDISDVIVPVLCEGFGTVRCQHGIIPVPVPAVANIVAAHNVPLRILDVQGELVTPTGAALVAAVRTRNTLPECFTIERVGLGAGKREYETPGILRAMLIEEG